MGNIKETVKSICKIGQGNNCCRYLLVGPNGFECAKLTSTAAHLDARVAGETIVARGNNCDGYNSATSIKVLN